MTGNARKALLPAVCALLLAAVLTACAGQGTDPETTDPSSSVTEGESIGGETGAGTEADEPTSPQETAAEPETRIADETTPGETSGTDTQPGSPETDPADPGDDTAVETQEETAADTASETETESESETTSGGVILPRDEF